MIDARFRIELPAGLWVAEVSTAVPDATFRLLSGLRTGDGAVELGEVVTDDPVTVRNGWYEFDLTRTRGEFEALRDTLEASPLSYEPLSVVHTDEDEDILTDRQREFLYAALREVTRSHQIRVWQRQARRCRR
jgi:hypothetical protein